MYLGENQQKALEEFFRHPTRKFQIRELSRETGLSLPTIKDYLAEFMEKGLVEKVEEGVYPGYRASMNDSFRLYKKLWTVEKLHETGLVEKLEKELHPDSVVLFGSAARGEDIEKSDIDILVVSESRDINIKKFEDKFNREINLQFMVVEELKKNRELANNIANGIVLSGYLVVK
ncbi:MAG: nucleotidyltransferase domain-containing protein [Candidatus Nanohaloarchaea archaeon]|nr:nucleotidyltransferase domain-containing protein [Candidatus Nanohaloarchaea archaeon]